jgi:dihydroorotate dehydrogenase
LIYRALFELLLKHVDPERAHAFASRILRLLVAIPGVPWVLRRGAAPHDPALRVSALGLAFPSPLGVAAGVDKDGTWSRALGLLGFGFVEVGTVTARPQQGNERPRVFRIPPKRALLNRMGFPNPGAVLVTSRLRERAAEPVVGVNVGKSKAVALADAGEDYRAAVRELAPVSDYIALNVSSPNTPELREMQAVELLAPLIDDVRAGLRDAGVSRPLLVKIAPDLPDEEIVAIADLALELSLDGIVAVNTTIDRAVLHPDGDSLASVQGGGVSGPPLAARALEVLRLLRARVGERLVLVSVGGVQEPGDVWERIRAGATLVQAYTGFVYGGPAWPRQVNRELARRVREAGRSSIQELVGSESAATVPPCVSPRGT